MDILPRGIRTGWWERSRRIAWVQFRSLRTPLLVAASIELLWIPLSGLIPDFGDPLISARIQSLGFEAALPASLLMVFLGTLQARDGGSLSWLRLLSRHPFEIILGYSLWGISSSAVLLIAGSPSLVLGMAGAAPELPWMGRGLFSILAVVSNLYVIVPLIAFQFWAVIRPERSPGRDAFWIGIQFGCGILLAVAVNFLGSQSSSTGPTLLPLLCASIVLIASPMITLFLLDRATANLSRFE